MTMTQEADKKTFFNTLKQNTIQNLKKYTRWLHQIQNFK